MYVEGFAIAVKAARKDEYVRFAKLAAKVFRDHGALRVVECWADDVKPGKLTSFPQAVALREDEAVVFAWIEFPDRATRDAAMKTTFDDPRMEAARTGEYPFDGARMIFGGFETLIDE